MIEYSTLCQWLEHVMPEDEETRYFTCQIVGNPLHLRVFGRNIPLGLWQVSGYVDGQEVASLLAFSKRYAETRVAKEIHTLVQAHVAVLVAESFTHGE